jgi:hypothetical protein
MGGRKIIPEYLQTLPASLRFSNNPVETWDNVPDGKMHKIRIQHGGIDEEFYIAEIAGKRLSVTYVDGGGSAQAAQKSAPAPPEATSSKHMGVLPMSAAGSGDVSTLGTYSWDFG